MNRPSLLAIVCIFMAATSACTHLFESPMTSWVGSSLDEFEEAYAGQAIEVGVGGPNEAGLTSRSYMLEGEECTVTWDVDEGNVIRAWRHSGKDCKSTFP